MVLTKEKRSDIFKAPNGDKGGEHMDLCRLRGEIVAAYRTQSAFADAIGWHKNKVTNMLNGKYKPDTDEVAMIADMLQLDANGFCTIFLTRKSPNGD